jgi:hypothetical protein
MASANINAADLAHRITLRVSGLRLMEFRMRVAARIFRIGAWVAGVGIVIERSGSDVTP